MRRRVVLVGTMILLLLLRGRAITSALWTNAGMLLLRDAHLTQVDRVPDTDTVLDALGENAAAARAVQYLRQAVALNGDDPVARWGLGRAALAVGDAGTAADALGPLAGSAGHDPLLYNDVLVALSYGGQPEGVVALYDSVPPMQRTQAISDVVALAYLDLAAGEQVGGETGGQGGVGQCLQQASALRPSDLYANYHLWRRALQSGDLAGATVYSETLTYFSLEAVHPADERLLEYAADVIPALLEDGLWDRERTLNVVSFLVWQHNQAAGTARLLERLIERYPAEPEWSFYLAELYHRRGDLDQAEASYRRVLDIDPNYAQAYLRMGMIYEERAGRETDR
jgi:tetratricopeptide (TPR) repeat protein